MKLGYYWKVGVVVEPEVVFSPRVASTVMLPVLPVVPAGLEQAFDKEYFPWASVVIEKVVFPFTKSFVVLFVIITVMEIAVLAGKPESSAVTVVIPPPTIVLAPVGPTLETVGFSEARAGEDQKTKAQRTAESWQWRKFMVHVLEERVEMWKYEAIYNRLKIIAREIVG